MKINFSIRRCPRTATITTAFLLLALASIARAQSITVNGNQVNLTWTNNTAAGFILFSTTNLAPPTSWVAVTNPPVAVGNRFRVTLPIADRVQLFELVAVGHAKTWYVSQNSEVNGPGTSWNNAFHDIQSAVNVAINGNTVLVSNGNYSTGGVAGPDGVTNVVYVPNAITLRSANGPGATYITGGGMPAWNFFAPPATSRCVYVGTNAILSGFTLENGYSGSAAGGGAYADSGAIIANCAFIANYACLYGGGISGGTLLNCTFTNNEAPGNGGGPGGIGGGAFGATLYNCILYQNFSIAIGAEAAGPSEGGGAANCTLNGCAVTDNRALVGDGFAASGGGVYNCTLNFCVLSGNDCFGSGGSGPGGIGGGADGGTLNNCVVSNNACDIFGGGTAVATLNNCLVIGNFAASGGGAYGCTLINCTVVSNTAESIGGIGRSAATNSIIFTNIAVDTNSVPIYPNCDTNSVLAYSSTTPQAPGVGNIPSDPQFVNPGAGNYHLQSTSPCINAGDNAATVGIFDLDGYPRIVFGTVDMGCYEYQGP